MPIWIERGTLLQLGGMGVNVAINFPRSWQSMAFDLTVIMIPVNANQTPSLASRVSVPRPGVVVEVVVDRGGGPALMPTLLTMPPSTR